MERGVDGSLDGGAALTLARCKALEELDFRGSGIGDDAARALAQRLPRAQKVRHERRLGPRPVGIARFNGHVAAQRQRHAAAVALQAYGRRRVARVATKAEKAGQVWASGHLQRLAKGFVARREAKRRAGAGAKIRAWASEQLHRQFLRRWWRAEAALRARKRAEETAALLLGAHWRGVKARRLARRAKMRRDRCLVNLAALVDGLQRKRHSELMWGMALRCQVVYKKCRKANFDRRCEEGAVTFQRAFRGVSSAGTACDSFNLTCVYVYSAIFWTVRCLLPLAFLRGAEVFTAPNVHMFIRKQTRQ